MENCGCALRGKMKSFGCFQLIAFAAFLVMLATLKTTWFGYKGISAISGFILFMHPTAVAGTALFLIAVWFNFKSARRRRAFGYTGLALLFFAEMLEFFTFPSGSVTGIQIWMFSYDVPSLYDFSIRGCFITARPGFYLSFISTLLTGILFYVFTRKIAE